MAWNPGIVADDAGVVRQGGAASIEKDRGPSIPLGASSFFREPWNPAQGTGLTPGRTATANDHTGSAENG